MTANRRFATGRLGGNATPLLAVLPLLGLLSAPVQACITVSGTLRISGTLTTNCVVVNTNGTIIIENGGTLVLTGTWGDVSTVNSDGSIVLAGATSQLRFTTNNHTVCGSGCIRGLHEEGGIYIPEGVTLTNTTTISGALRIHGPGNFVNQGIVDANSNGVLRIAVTGTLDDTAGDRWMATAANSILSFESALGTISTDGKLSGNFIISGAATAEIENHEAGLRTEGRLEMSNGLLDVQENLTMGDDCNYLMSLTDDDATGSPRIVVASGKTFTHH